LLFDKRALFVICDTAQARATCAPHQRALAKKALKKKPTTTATTCLPLHRLLCAPAVRTYRERSPCAPASFSVSCERGRLCRGVVVDEDVVSGGCPGTCGLKRLPYRGFLVVPYRFVAVCLRCCCLRGRATTADFSPSAGLRPACSLSRWLSGSVLMACWARQILLRFRWLFAACGMPGDAAGIRLLLRGVRRCWCCGGCRVVANERYAARAAGTHYAGFSTVQRGRPMRGVLRMLCRRTTALLCPATPHAPAHAPVALPTGYSVIYHATGSGPSILYGA